MSSKSVALCTAAGAGLAGAGYVLWRACAAAAARRRLPSSWRLVGTLNELLAYPIKSCRWVELDEAELTYMGLRVDWLRDRTLMVVDEKANFVSARAYPEMLRVQVKYEGSRLTLSHPEMEPLALELAEALRAPARRATVWGTAVDVRDCGWEPAEWFSRLLKHEADSMRLVYYASSQCRRLRATTNPIFRYTAHDTGALPDETSYNLINEASVDDLNRRLKDTVVKPRNFRPNFVLKGAKPLEEDNWKFVRIGDNIFEIIKPCTRCIMTTIDPDTAIKETKCEPLNTLKTYRQSQDPAFRRSAGSSPRMGIQMALRSPPGGRVSINDPIYVSC